VLVELVRSARSSNSDLNVSAMLCSRSGAGGIEELLGQSAVDSGLYELLVKRLQYWWATIIRIS
jgi:hypothetical protein